MVWKVAPNPLESTILGKEVGRTSKGRVGMRPITIIVTIGLIYRESPIMPERLRRANSSKRETNILRKSLVGEE